MFVNFVERILLHSPNHAFCASNMLWQQCCHVLEVAWDLREMLMKILQEGMLFTKMDRQPIGQCISVVSMPLWKAMSPCRHEPTRWKQQSVKVNRFKVNIASVRFHPHFAFWLTKAGFASYLWNNEQFHLELRNSIESGLVMSSQDTQTIIQHRQGIRISGFVARQQKSLIPPLPFDFLS